MWYAGKFVDTVVMNPPFGTRRKGVDMEFLSVALKVSVIFLIKFASFILSIFLS